MDGHLNVPRGTWGGRPEHGNRPGAVLRDGATGRWLCFDAPTRIVTARRKGEVAAALREVESSVGQGLWAAGFVSYEAAQGLDSSLPAKDDGIFPLVWFGLFPACSEMRALPKTSEEDSAVAWQREITSGEYRRRFHAIRAYIRSGDTYQVNFTHRLRATADIDIWRYFLWMMAHDDAPYGAYVDAGEWAICSASPELFFRLEDNRIESRPMKGTAARGLWTEDDVSKAEALRSSEKERAENVMIVDMVRNDLGRIAEIGSVTVPALFDVERYPTVWQMTSTVRAETSEPLDRIFSALFPPASVTGAPKRRTMEIIAELETTPRRIYTGAIGFVAPGRVAQFSVAIRTVLKNRISHELEYGVGGGIVWDSDPEREIEECAVKSRVLSSRRPPFDLIETILWTPDAGYALLEYHLRRLSGSAQYFRFPFDPGRVRKTLADATISFGAGPQRVRLVLSRDGSVRVECATVAIQKARFTDVALARMPIDVEDVFLYHKTTHRRLYHDILAGRPGHDDVLMFNARGEITETTIANVAFERDGRLYTPPLRCGLLPGTYRRWLLDRGGLTERIVTVDEALRCGEVYLMNSVRGMQKVRIIP